MKDIGKFRKLCCKHKLESQMKNENILINTIKIAEIFKILEFYFISIVLLIVVLLAIADPFNVKVL
jgi:hypothetical protein